MSLPSMRKKAAGTPYGRVLLGDPCAWCAERDCTTLDHVQPLAYGGDSGWDNLVGVCDRCNRSRGGKSLLSHLIWRAGLERQWRDTRQLITRWASVGRTA